MEVPWFFEQDTYLQYLQQLKRESKNHMSAHSNIITVFERSVNERSEVKIIAKRLKILFSKTL